MMCYKDQTFCSDDKHCTTSDCGRRLTEKDHENLKKRWMPVSMASFKDHCGKYKEIAA